VGSDAKDVPTLFVAVTENVYDVPFERSAMVQLAADVVHVFPPGDEVTV